MKFNSELVKSGAVIAVGVSGGRDSVALLHYLAENREKFGVEVKAICVEHGIRECATRERLGVQELCERLGVECKVFKVDALGYAKEKKLTVEQSARILRYDCFESAVKDGFCDTIATAHHLSDNVETVLMRIFRGTGIKGLGGIKERRDFYIRPLLSTPRKEIDEYVEKYNLPYFEDETNVDTRYTRNYIRHKVLPVILDRYPGAEENVERLAKLSAVDEAHFEKIVNEKIKTMSYGAVGVSVDETKDMAVFSRLIRRAFSLLGVDVDVEDRHVSLIESLTSGENGDTLDMPYGVKVIREYDDIVFFREGEREDREIPLVQKNFEFTLGENFRVSEADKRGTTGLFIDYDKACGAVFRYKRDGDVFKRFGGGTKSLGDYFTDTKLPVRIRDRVVVLARDKEVLAVLGVEISEKVKIDENTKNIIELTGGEYVLGR